MTTLWKITPEWKGKTVAVLACGPSMSAEVAAALAVDHLCIVVNAAQRVAPWAAMMVALDPWTYELEDTRAFEGTRVCGVDVDGLDALYPGPMWERVTLAPGHVIEIRNSGLAAIRIAAALGASRIILAGFDPEVPRHFYDDEVDTGDYVGLAPALVAITAELAAQGIQVERYAAPAAQEVEHHRV